jgi:hypothetical protein
MKVKWEKRINVVELLHVREKVEWLFGVEGPIKRRLEWVSHEMIKVGHGRRNETFLEY